MRATVRWLSTAALLIGSACDSPLSPTRSLTGQWTAQVGHGDFWVLTLVQSGDAVSGTACLGNALGQRTPDVPVSGGYPRLRFEYTEVFEGRHESERDQIAGDYGVGPQRYSLRFNRDNTVVCKSNP
jgi:hypothetical protein